ncbi:MAG: hypothetical protein AOA65_0416 [Candidatus Bathyarchaeota archaeon BA1]|nr:MAG: hypothetical protein AOA65_0416 [Candidatus Bathyarchaeota archaeon BA1]
MTLPPLPFLAMDLTKVALAMEKAGEILREALRAARERGEDKETFFGRLANAYAELAASFALMEAYGKIDPETSRRIGEVFKPNI